MASLLDAVLGDPDDPGRNVAYILTACFAVGIWLVVRRYEDAKNRPVPFAWEAPEARLLI